MNRRVRPVAPRARLLPALLVLAVVILGFATLMVRLELMREGYRLSELSADIARLQEENRALRLRAAQLASPERLRTLAAKYHLGPPAAGQVIVLR